MAQVHRFRDCVAAALGDGSTVYLKPHEAEHIARAMLACVKDIRTHERFADSRFPSRNIFFGRDDLTQYPRKES